MVLSRAFLKSLEFLSFLSSCRVAICSSPQNSLLSAFSVRATPPPFLVASSKQVLYLSERLVKQQFDELQQFLMDSNNAARQAMRGVLFEKLAHVRLAAGGEFRVRRLTKKSEKDGEESDLFLPAASEIFVFEGLNEVALVEGDGRYFKPNAANLEAVDSFIKV